MGKGRGHLKKDDMLAACIRALFPQTFPHSRAIDMTAKEVISEIDFDHDPVPHAEGGSDEHHNLTPRLRADHRRKTAEEDIPRIAKNKRIARKHALHKAKMAAKAGQPIELSHALELVHALMKFNKPKRKIRSRNNLRREA